MQIIVRPAAASDIEAALRWYERQRTDLGNKFLAAVHATLERIATNPRMYALIHRDSRRAFVARFPYGIYYRVYDESIVIVACMHARRDPRRWKSRV